MHRAALHELRAAARAAWEIVTRAAPIMRSLPDAALRAIHIPDAALAVSRLADPDRRESFLVRFDFALTPEGPKVLEINAETPFFLWESYEIAGATARAWGYADPNSGARQRLVEALRHALAEPSGTRIAVAAHNTWREEWFTALFAARLASEAIERPVDAIPLHELHIENGALCAGDGSRIDTLWRFYPIEHLALDRSGPRLFELVRRRALRLINPPTALLLQNKALLAIIFDLYKRALLFDDRERELVSRYFLPTYLTLPVDNAIYVRKPVLGREGDSVAIVSGGEVICAAPAQRYRQQPMVYQRYVELPQINGAKAVASCFVVADEPGAVALRIGATITDIHAQFLSIGELPD